MLAHRIVFIGCILVSSTAVAHDTWVETNVNVIRSSDAVHIDLKLGNHGNDHRDFKLASKLNMKDCKLEVVAPDGSRYDLRDRLIDVGYSPQEGYWTAKFAASDPGLYTVVHSYDRVVPYAPIRAIKSGKTMFVVSQSLDRVPKDHAGFDRVEGHVLELVPTTNPVTPMGPGQPINVRVLFKGKPLPGARVSFIPRGQQLAEGMDSKYERVSNEKGDASFAPSSGNVYLIVVHHTEPDASGEGYDSTKYSATLVVFVPEACSCCSQ